MGDQFIGFKGSLFVISYEQPDHSLRHEVTISIEATAGWPNGLYARLEGPGLAGIEALNHQPVRIWGTFGDPYAQPPVWQVEHYEPVDPGAVYQGWLGTIEHVMVNGQSVTRFTTQEGQIYVLGDSIDNEPDANMGNPGDLLVVEGLIIPGDAFGGLPVMRQTTINLVSNLPEPGAYLEQVKKPIIVPSNQSGIVSIDKVELVYSTPDQNYMAQPITGAPLIAQPVWRFSGRSDSGLLVELQIQAISPEYLK